MTVEEFCNKVRDLCDQASEPYMKNCIIKRASELDRESGLNAERHTELEMMLYRCLTMADRYIEGQVYACLKRDVPGLREWLDANDNRLAKTAKRAELMEEREKFRDALAEIERQINSLSHDISQHS